MPTDSNETLVKEKSSGMASNPQGKTVDYRSQDQPEIICEQG